MLRALLVFACAATAIGCYRSESPPRPVEIGVAEGEGCSSTEPWHCSFTPLADGDSLPIVLGIAGINLTLVSLRVEGIDPNEPDISITVSVDGLALAHEVPGDVHELVPDGTAYGLWDVRVMFMTELCCFACREGLIDAHMRDAAEREFRGSVRVLLARPECPDPFACCVDAEYCPDPSMTQLCK